MKKFIFLLCFQFLFFAGWYGLNQYYWDHSPTVRLELGPIDPYDPLRGRYFILNPKIRTEIEKEFTAGTWKQNDRFYAIVQKDSSGISRFDHIQKEKPTTLNPDQHALRGKYSSGWRNRADLNLERFYLPAQLQLPHGEREEGWEIEVIIRPNGTVAPKRLLFKGDPVYPRNSS